MDDTGNLLPQGETVPDPNAQAPVSGGEPGENLVVIPLTSEQINDWFTEIEDARNVRKEIEDKWDILMKEYIPNVSAGAEDIKAGIHFRNVHTKKAKLFLKNPELTLTPRGPLKDVTIDPMSGMVLSAEDSAAVKKEVLNAKLGRKGVNASRMVGECLFDILAWAGKGCTKIGYRNVKKTIQQPVMVPDPAWIPPQPPPGSMLGLQPMTQPPMIPQIDPLTGQPVMQDVVVVIWEEWYWNRFSPKKMLVPANLKSVDYDREADWLGMEFFMPVHTFRATFNVPEGVEVPTTSNEDDRSYQHSQTKGMREKNLVHGVEIFYKASTRDANEIHPQAMRQLVFVEGDKQNVYVHRPSPDQTFDTQGKLTPDSLVGFPYHIFTNRDMSDSAHPWADNAFTDSEVKHINTHRKQSVQLRDANIGKWLYDVGAFPPDQIREIQQAKVGAWIAVQEGRLSAGQDKIVVPLVKSEAARDDWRTAQTLKQDVQETLGIGGTNAGATEDTVRTATEIATSASALAERMEDEQNRILDQFLEGVEKFDCLLQRYADEGDYVEWVGKDGMKRLSMWNRQVISGKWAYDAKPDSQLRVDIARERAQLLQATKELAPFHMVFLNLKPIVKRLANTFHIDPAEIFLPDMMPVAGAPPGPGQAPAGPGGPPTPGPAGASPGGPKPPSPGAMPNAAEPGKGTPQVQRSTEA